MISQETLSFHTNGRGTTNISGQLNAVVSISDIKTGIANIFVQHTSASLILCENADPTVRRDLEAFMSRVTPDGDPLYQHIDEGPDDMSAHVRTVLTDSSLNIPFRAGQLLLGTWQGVFLWEHRTQPHKRQIIISLYGE
jgi:secondary thiamine-phosphate synthase enzyme